MPEAGRSAGPDAGREYAIVARRHGAYFATTADGFSALLIPVAEGRPPLDRSAGGVRLRFRPGVSFDIPGASFRSSAAVIECVHENLDETFRVLAEDVAARTTIGTRRPVPHEVSTALARWEELLRAKRTLSRNEAVGLWGELWTLLELHDPAAGVAAWRGPADESVDFVGGGVGVECKTSMRRLEHWVSQEQVTRPLGDTDVYVLSIWVTHDASAGTSLPELVARIDERLDDRAAFEEKLLATGYSRVDAEGYDVRLRVLEPPFLIPTDAVPRVRTFDTGISHIRFLASLPDDRALRAEDAIAVLARLSG